MANRDLLEDLRTAIGEYLEVHKNLSIQSISNRAHVSYSTIRRILQDEAKDVRDETILSLIQVVMTRDQRVTFLNRYYPSLGALIAQSSSLDRNLDHEKIRKYRYKDPHNYVMKLAISDAGTTRTSVIKLLGERGNLALDEMIEDRFLFEDKDGRVRHESDSTFIMNADDILFQIKKDSDYFDKSLIGSKFSRLAHLSASISQEAYQELMTTVNEFVRKVERLKEAPENSGDIPIFIDLMTNTYDKETLEGVS